jgi:NTE family protein
LSDDPQLRPLHPGILGLRLTPGFEDPEKNATAVAEVAGTFNTLSQHMQSILATVLAPSEEGQIRTPAEKEQTIDLYTETLETTEFAPSEAKSRVPIENARRKMYNYFNMSG